MLKKHIYSYVTVSCLDPLATFSTCLTLALAACRDSHERCSDEWSLLRPLPGKTGQRSMLLGVWVLAAVPCDWISSPLAVQLESCFRIGKRQAQGHPKSSFQFWRMLEINRVGPLQILLGFFASFSSGEALGGTLPNSERGEENKKKHRVFLGEETHHVVLVPVGSSMILLCLEHYVRASSSSPCWPPALSLSRLLLAPLSSAPVRVSPSPSPPRVPPPPSFFAASFNLSLSSPPPPTPRQPSSLTPSLSPIFLQGSPPSLHQPTFPASKPHIRRPPP